MPFSPYASHFQSQLRRFYYTFQIKTFCILIFCNEFELDTKSLY